MACAAVALVERDVDRLLEARRIHEACDRPVEVVQDDEALTVTLCRLGRLDEAAPRMDVCLNGCEALGITLVPERLRRTVAAVRHRQGEAAHRPGHDRVGFAHRDGAPRRRRSWRADARTLRWPPNC